MSKVLIVDDHATNIRILTRQLQLWGMEVASAESGTAALAWLEQAGDPSAPDARLPDIIITDMHMPEMDGFTLTRNIKQDARFHGLPVVIHSSLSGSANEDHVRSVGADGYVAKFVAEDLAQTLRQVLP